MTAVRSNQHCARTLYHLAFLPVTMLGVRNMTGRAYLRLQWASWIGCVICTVLIALWMDWVVAVVLAVFPLYGIRVNLTTGRKVAARIDAERPR